MDKSMTSPEDCATLGDVSEITMRHAASLNAPMTESPIRAGKPFSPEQLAVDFGSNAPHSLAVRGIHTLCKAIQTTSHRQARASFDRWKILFGEACGRDLDSPSEIGRAHV